MLQHLPCLDLSFLSPGADLFLIWCKYSRACPALSDIALFDGWGLSPGAEVMEGHHPFLVRGHFDQPILMNFLQVVQSCL